MRVSNNLVPIIAKEQFDDIASDFLNKYYPQAIEEPLKVPIESIATDLMKLMIKRVHLTEDLSVLGQMFFSAGTTELYLKDTDEFIYDFVEKGTMFIDPDVLTRRNIGSERNTIAHECVHWYIHRQYHFMQVKAGGGKAVASRCPVNTPIESQKSIWQEEDWMEWHANSIAPKILMPKKATISYAHNHPYYMKIQKNTAFLDALVDDLADFFEVSKQSASIRLTELSLISIFFYFNVS